MIFFVKHKTADTSNWFKEKFEQNIIESGFSVMSIDYNSEETYDCQRSHLSKIDEDHLIKIPFNSIENSFPHRFRLISLLEKLSLTKRNSFQHIFISWNEAFDFSLFLMIRKICFHWSWVFGSNLNRVCKNCSFNLNKNFPKSEVFSENLDEGINYRKKFSLNSIELIRTKIFSESSLMMCVGVFLLT